MFLLYINPFYFLKSLSSFYSHANIKRSPKPGSLIRVHALNFYLVFLLILHSWTLCQVLQLLSPGYSFVCFPHFKISC